MRLKPTAIAHSGTCRKRGSIVKSKERFLSQMELSSERAKQDRCPGRGRYAAAKNLARTDGVSVIAPVGRFLRRDDSSLERDPGKQSLATTVSINRGTRCNARLHIAADRSGSRT